MAAPQAVGVVICQGRQPALDSPTHRRLFWTAQAALPQGRVATITHACRDEGADALAELVAAHGWREVLVAGCPRAWEATRLAARLTARGLAEVNLCTLGDCLEGGSGEQPCTVAPGGPARLGQALALLGGQAAEPAPGEKPCPRLLVLGSGLAALTAARGWAGLGQPVLLVTPGRRLAPPEPLLPPAAQEEARRLAEDLPAGLEVVAGGRLLGLQGVAGAFTVLVQARDGDLVERPVGAVIVAQDPPHGLNWEPGRLPESPRVVPLEELCRLLDSPAHWRARSGREAPAVGLAVGLWREASPLALAAAARAAVAILAQPGAAVYLLADNVKVASGDLESLTQAAREAGVFCFKTTGQRPGIASEGEGFTITLRDEVLDRPVALPVDILAVDTLPAPDREYRAWAARLGLAAGEAGCLQADRVGLLPTRTARAGVFAVGEGRGPGDPEARLTEVAASLAAASELLLGSRPGPQGGVPVVDRKRCALCLTCVRVCPQGAIVRQGRRPVMNPLACTACGTCAAECPMEAIQLPGREDGRYRRAVEAGLPRRKDGAPLAVEEPAVLVLACANSAGRALDELLAGGWRWPAAARVIRVPCAGKLDPLMIWEALQRGYDLVLALACHHDACHSVEGSGWARLRFARLHEEMSALGLDPVRLRWAEVAAARPAGVRQAVEEACRQAEALERNPLRATGAIRAELGRYAVRVTPDYTLLD